MKTLVLLTGALLIVSSLFGSVVVVELPKEMDVVLSVNSLSISTEAPIIGEMLDLSKDLSPRVNVGVELRGEDLNSDKRDSLITEVWNNNENEWQKRWKESYTYNSNGYPIEYIVSTWNGSSWTYENKMSYDLDNNGNVLTINTSIYSSQNQAWIEIVKVQCKYDKNGNRSEWVMNRFSGSNNTWEQYSKRTFVSDKKQREISIIDYSWNAANSSWEYLQKNDYQYYDDIVIQTITFAWMSERNAWEYFKLHQTELDDNGNIIEKSECYWNIIDSSWVNIQKEEMVYDTDGNMYQSTIATWNVKREAWVDVTRYLYTYDNAGVGSINAKFDWKEELGDWLGDWRNDDFIYDEKGNIIEYSVFDWANTLSSWVHNERKLFYYSAEFITNTNYSNFNKRVIVYPNPTTEAISFNLENCSDQASLELYNIQGKKVLSAEVANAELISVNHLEAGIYTFMIKNNSETIKGSVVKQ